MVLLRRALPLAAFLLLLFISFSYAVEKAYKLKIEGMHCKTCVYRVTKALERLPDVKEVVVTLEDGQAVVWLDEGKDKSYDELKQAVSDSGYILNGMEPATEADTGQ